MSHRIDRSFAALVALWSLVASGSPVPLHRCLMHAHAATHAATMSHATDDGMADDAAMMRDGGMTRDDGGAIAHVAGEEQTPRAPSDQDDECRCVGCCCASAVVGLAPLAAAMPAPRDVAVRVAAFAVPQAPHAERAPHILPFGNGPPAV
jgi:hypothetical protein